MYGNAFSCLFPFSSEGGCSLQSPPWASTFIYAGTTRSLATGSRPPAVLLLDKTTTKHIVERMIKLQENIAKYFNFKICKSEHWRQFSLYTEALFIKHTAYSTLTDKMCCTAGSTMAQFSVLYNWLDWGLWLSEVSRHQKARYTLPP